MNKNVELLIKAALRAPTGDNCQPFRFKIENASEEAITLVLHHVEARAKHYFNANNCASLLALGAVLESLRIEAAGLGYQTQIILAKDVGSEQASNGNEWARVQLKRAAGHQERESLVGAFAKRWTCRFPLENEALPAALVSQCKAEVSSASNAVTPYYGKSTAPEFAKYFKTCELFMWKHQEAATGFLKSIRFPGPEAEQAVDGISIGELGVQSHEVVSLKLMRTFPAIIPVFFHLGLKIMAQQVAHRNYTQSGGLFVFCVDSKREPRQALIEVGQSVLRVWLLLNQQGYGVQPFTVSSQLCFQKQRQLLPTGVLPQFDQLLGEGLELWREHFKIAKDQEPVWALRVGRLPSSFKKFESRRLAVQDVIDG